MVTEVRIFGLDWSEDEVVKNYAEPETLGYEPEVSCTCTIFTLNDWNFSTHIANLALVLLQFEICRD